MSFFDKLFGKEPPPVAPFSWSARPLPSGNNLEELLPQRVGPFVRTELRPPAHVHQQPIYARYRKDSSEVFVELGICDDPGTAKMALSTARSELQADGGLTTNIYSGATDPGFLQCASPRLGAFVAWTRGSYFFSAHAKDDDSVLNEFITNFRY